MLWIFRDSDLDLEEPNVEGKVDMLVAECRKFYR